MSISGGVGKSIDRALSVGCTALQIFVKNNMQWFAKPLAQAEIDSFVSHPRRGELACVFAHSSYLINLCAVNGDFLERSIKALSEELVRADQLGLPFLVLHPGAHMEAGEEQGIKTVAASLDAVWKLIPQVKTKVALETTAGQGSSLGRTFEELADIIEKSKQPERLVVCADTAHLFAAGYDLTSEESTAKVFADLDRILGRDRLAAIHINDSKSAMGSRVDRHEAIGKGKIGLGAFRFVMNSPRLAAIPKVLETPKGEDLAEDVDNLATLRSLVA